MTMQTYKLPNGSVIGYDDKDVEIILNTDGSCEVKKNGIIVPNSPTHMVAYTIPAPTASQISDQEWTQYQALAKEALGKTDIPMLRITEAVTLGDTTTSAADVVAYINYRRSLRAILSQAKPKTIPTSLPVEPPYPVGT